MIISLSRSTILGSAVRKTDLMKTIDNVSVIRLKSEVVSPSKQSVRRAAVWRRNEEFVGPNVIWPLASQRDAQHFKNGLVKSATGWEVGDNKLNVVD